MSELERLKAERAELLAACKAFVVAWDKCLQLEKTDVALRMARSAIARAEESDRAARTDCMCRYCSGHLADPGTLHIPCDSQNCTCERQRLKAATRGEGSDGK